MICHCRSGDIGCALLSRLDVSIVSNFGIFGIRINAAVCHAM